VRERYEHFRARCTEEKPKLFNENGQVDLAYLINKLESSSITKTQKEEHIKKIFGTENYEKILKIIEPKNKEKNFNNIHKEITEFKEKNRYADCRR
jgi:hypothetical protein